MYKEWLNKFKENPIKVIGLALTYLGIAILMVPVFLSQFDFFRKIDFPDEMIFCFFILVVIGPVLQIISWIKNKELMREGGKMIIISGGWLILGAFGAGYWLANILIFASLALIGAGFILAVVNMIKTNRFTRKRPTSNNDSTTSTENDDL